MPVDSRVAEYFVAEVRRTFGFLHDEHGFEAPVTEIHDPFHYLIVRFTGREVAVDCILETREGDEDVSCVLARVTEDGVATETLAPDSARRRARLTSLLDACRVRYTVRSVAGLSLEQSISAVLEQDAGLLREHARDVLTGSAAIFERAWSSRR